MGSLHPVAVLVSGTGRHLENFELLARGGDLPIKVVTVLSNKNGIGALERAERLDLPSVVIDPERKLDDLAFSEQVFAFCEEAGAETILLAGLPRKLVVPKVWERRILNIHPALLPAFGGKGYWGDHVHRAVLGRGCWFTGCTVHYVDNDYDSGPILLQSVVPVEPGDDIHTLAGRVFEAEIEAYPQALRLHIEGRSR